MVEVKQEIPTNDRIFQDKTMQEICKSELYDVTRDPECWITELERLRGNLQKWKLSLMVWKLISTYCPAYLNNTRT